VDKVRPGGSAEGNTATDGLIAAPQSRTRVRTKLAHVMQCKDTFYFLKNRVYAYDKFYKEVVGGGVRCCFCNRSGMPPKEASPLKESATNLQ
jgi:hypothetical protein